MNWLANRSQSFIKGWNPFIRMTSMSVRLPTVTLVPSQAEVENRSAPSSEIIKSPKFLRSEQSNKSSTPSEPSDDQDPFKLPAKSFSLESRFLSENLCPFSDHHNNSKRMRSRRFWRRPCRIRPQQSLRIWVSKSEIHWSMSIVCQPTINVVVTINVCNEQI
jgi:hypothetical protein